jgi:uncharacterized protein (UPF0264 family)
MTAHDYIWFPRFEQEAVRASRSVAHSVERMKDMRPSFDFPRLLVSVRNANEAEAALAGGCDLLDIKEPALGALGMADPVTIAAVVSRVRELKSSVPVSVALGEAAERGRQRPLPHLPRQIAYMKLGTASLGCGAQGLRRLTKVKERFIDGERELTRWIAVAYADWEAARGPCPEEVVEGAREGGFAGVLIDTYSKEEGGLFNWLSIERLESLADQARSYDLEFALAGRLQIDDLPRIGLVSPDIVGIRSAACRSGLRTREIDATAVRRFRAALNAPSLRRTPASGPVYPGGVRVAPHV